MNEYTKLVNKLGTLYYDASEQYNTSPTCKLLCDAIEDLLRRAQVEPEYISEDEIDLDEE